VIADSGGVDQAATKTLRDEMRSSRGETKVFDFGPPIEKLRETCKADTGLEAPKQPEWKKPEAVAAE